ncbi:DUF2635 domain-containing protein [Serratia sp. CY76391]|uniref:DUF2635 domain-containing protein n=1 Tax=Serratia sp. CY76391 TaxID=3383681 RepID=UPI003FA14564
MFVKPVPGRLVRDPVKGTLLPENGAEVPDDAYFWRNRLRDGDVVKVEQPPDDATSAAEPAEAAAAPKNKKKEADA